MNFSLNGVKFYGRNGNTVHSLDVESSASELDEEITSMEENISLNCKKNLLIHPNKENRNLVKIDLRKYFPKSLLEYKAEKPYKHRSDKCNSSSHDARKKRISEKIENVFLEEFNSETESLKFSLSADRREKRFRKHKRSLSKDIHVFKEPPKSEKQLEINFLPFKSHDKKNIYKSGKRKRSLQKYDSETEIATTVMDFKIKDLHEETSTKPKQSKETTVLVKKEPSEPEDQPEIEFVPNNIKHITKRIDFPCVGLNHVYEIQKLNPLEDVIFYCELCDARCVQNAIILHLKSFKHHLRCLKMYNNVIYLKYRYKKKSLISHDVERRISILERKMGRGKITLKPNGYHLRPRTPSDSSSEEESVSSKVSYSQKSARGPSMDTGSAMVPHTFSTSLLPLPRCIPYDQRVSAIHSQCPLQMEEKSYHQFLKAAKKQEYAVPDMTKGDFYCKLCQCHMSSDLVWESHIVGKRHRKNLKKPPWEKPSKVKSIKIHGQHSRLYDELNCLEENPGPIVGLDYISEVTKSDRSLGSTYNCHLCSGCFTKLNIVDHLCTSKHRLKYIKEADEQTYDFLMAGNYSNTEFEYRVELKAKMLQDKFGCGEVEVRLEVNNDL